MPYPLYPSRPARSYPLWTVPLWTILGGESEEPDLPPVITRASSGGARPDYRDYALIAREDEEVMVLIACMLRKGLM